MIKASELKPYGVYYNYKDDRIEFLNPNGMRVAGEGYVPMLDNGKELYMILCSNHESEICYPLKYIGEL